MSTTAAELTKLINEQVAQAQAQLDEAFRVARDCGPEGLTIACRNVHLAEGRLIGLDSLRTRLGARGLINDFGDPIGLPPVILARQAAGFVLGVDK